MDFSLGSIQPDGLKNESPALLESSQKVMVPSAATDDKSLLTTATTTSPTCAPTHRAACSITIKPTDSRIVRPITVYTPPDTTSISTATPPAHMRERATSTICKPPSTASTMVSSHSVDSLASWQNQFDYRFHAKCAQGCGSEDSDGFSRECQTNEHQQQVDGCNREKSSGPELRDGFTAPRRSEIRDGFISSHSPEVRDGFISPHSPEVRDGFISPRRQVVRDGFSSSRRSEVRDGFSPMAPQSFAKPTASPDRAMVKRCSPFFYTARRFPPRLPTTHSMGLGSCTETSSTTGPHRRPGGSAISTSRCRTAQSTVASREVRGRAVSRNSRCTPDQIQVSTPAFASSGAHSPKRREGIRTEALAAAPCQPPHWHRHTDGQTSSSTARRHHGTWRRTTSRDHQKQSKKHPALPGVACDQPRGDIPH